MILIIRSFSSSTFQLVHMKRFNMKNVTLKESQTETRSDKLIINSIISLKDDTLRLFIIISIHENFVHFMIL